jgi:hypothetical protein
MNVICIPGRGVIESTSVATGENILINIIRRITVTRSYVSV